MSHSRSSLFDAATDFSPCCKGRGIHERQSMGQIPYVERDLKTFSRHKRRGTCNSSWCQDRQKNNNIVRTMLQVRRKGCQEDRRERKKDNKQQEERNERN